IVVPALIDPSAAPKGYATIELLTLMPNEAAAAWFDDTLDPEHKTLRRSNSYAARKSELGDRLIAKAETVLPGLSDHIVFRTDASPVTFARYDWSSDGAIYGTRIPGFAGNKAPLPGLVLAGAATHGAGIEAVAISGARAAEALMPGLLRQNATDGNPPKG
ncbi:MAG: amine oxidase, partial [Hyphomicrobiales bacterium]|nr:amine oxidase [Hyphomicrobiales bacterium]